MDYRQDKQNCLGYALGIIGYDQLKEVYPRSFGDEPETPDSAEAFSKKLSTLGFVSRQLPEPHNPIEEGEFVIAFCGLLPIAERIIGYKSYKYDFHVAKFTDGTWHHKPNWDDGPCATTLPDLLDDHGLDVMFFAVQKEAP